MRSVRRVLVVLLVLGALALVARSFVPPRIEAGSALWIELSGSFVEAPEVPLAQRLLGVKQRSFASLLSELRKAERDDRLGHVVLQVRGLEVGWAKAQEIRDAIAALRAAGRNTVAYLEVPAFGANLDYYVASAAEAIHLAPGGGAPVLGLAGEYLFLGGLWDQLGVRLEVSQAGRYKGAAESIAGREMSEAFREQAEALLDAVDAQFVGGIAEGRGLEPEAVRRAIAAAPSEGEVLLELGWVDAVGTRQELLAALGDPPVVEEAEYAQVAPGQVGIEPAATFALIFGTGAVVAGRDASGPAGRMVLAADDVIEALDAAAADDGIAAIVLRIDSPGGGPFPSELVWHAIRRVREQKPVVASFSDLAASGAYYLASAADALVAGPATLTGSIGVFAIRPSLGDALGKLGIGAASLSRAPHAELLLATPPLSPDTRAWLEADVEAVYRRFVARVAEGRGLERDAVDAVAQGRVWTGEQAAELGLVDALGGLRVAAAQAKERLGMDPDADVALKVYPPPQPLAVQLREALGVRVAEGLRASVPWMGAVARAEAWLAALAAGGPVAVPPVWIEIR